MSPVFFVLFLAIAALLPACASTSVQQPPSFSQQDQQETTPTFIPNRRTTTSSLFTSGASRARRDIDRMGREAVCDVKTNGELSRAQRAWLLSWCGLRTKNHALIKANAPRALLFFQDTNDIRRQTEGHLILALANLHQPSVCQKHLNQAQFLLTTSREPILGPLADPYAGDLPYLLASISRYGFSLHTRARTTKKDKRPTRLSTTSLFDLAQFEYTHFQRTYALPHVLRGKSAWALQRGEVNQSAFFLRQVMEMDRRNANPQGLHEDFLLLARLANASGAASLGQTVEDWLIETLGYDYLKNEQASQKTSSVSLRHTLHTSAGRNSLLWLLRVLRNDTGRHHKKRKALLNMLASHKNLSVFRGDAWKLAFEAGRLFSERGLRNQANRYFTRALTALESFSSSIPERSQRMALFQQARPLFMQIIHNLVGIDTRHLTQRDYTRALHYVGRAKARGLHELFAKAAKPSSEHQLPQLQTKNADVHILAVRLEKILSRWSTGERPQLQKMQGAPSLVPLPNKHAALEYFIGERSGYVWIWHKNRLKMRRIAGWRTLRPLLDAFRKTLVDHKLEAQNYKTHRKLSERLYVELIGPVEDLIVDADRLVIAPDSILHDLPFEALAKPSREKIPYYMIRTHALSYVPSLTILSLLSARKTKVWKRAGKALVLGSPTLSQAGVELLTIGRKLPLKGMFRLAEMFPELPWSKRELQNVTKVLRTKLGVTPTLWTEKRASEASWRSVNLEEYRYIHIATHGLSDAPSWKEPDRTYTFTQPALLLSRSATNPEDGVLQLEDIFQTKTAADLVVLSGCTTGRGWRALGDGSYGLAGAFLFSGSRAVIASTWSVADKPTSMLMQRLYGEMKTSKQVSSALRKAQLKMLSYKPTPKAPYLPPFYWAGFRVIGGI